MQGYRETGRRVYLISLWRNTVMYFDVLPLKGNAVAGTRNFVIGLSLALAAMSGHARADDGVRVPSDLCSWNASAWRDFNTAEKAAWSGLGWNRHLWDEAEPASYPASYRMTWPELSGTNKKLAAKLGYSSQTWDVEGCPNYSTLAKNNASPAPVQNKAAASKTVQKKKVEPAPVQRKKAASKTVRQRTILLPPVHRNAGVVILGGISNSLE